MEHNCPACGRAHAAPDDWGGRKVRCLCGYRWKLPPPIYEATFSDTPPAPAEDPQPYRPPESPTVPQLLPERGDRRYRKKLCARIRIAVWILATGLLVLIAAIPIQDALLRGDARDLGDTIVGVMCLAIPVYGGAFVADRIVGLVFDAV